MTTHRSKDVCGATLTRRQFVKSGGALFVGISLVGPELMKMKKTVLAATVKNTLDPTVPSSWFEIHADNTILIRTGRVDFGQSTVTTAYKQIVAEELGVPFEAVTTIVMGDTDQTPDGGVSAAYLEYGALNLRKAAAYTRQALLDLAANRLGVDTRALTVKDGVVTGAGQRLTYGELVRGQHLTLTIPVTGDLTSFMGLTVSGNPPMKPVSEYTIIGRSYLNYVTESKVRAEETWASDVRLPGMVHARVVHPKTLGSTLIAAGRVDTKRFPNAQVVVKGNLVGVVAPTEWEAIGATQQVAADTKWTAWKALPGHGKLFKWMREEVDWKTAPVTTSRKSQGTVPPALAAASRKLSATYEIPFMKHAPIGPTMAVADARPDGTFYIYTHCQNPQPLRGQIARMLGTPIDNVVIRLFAGPGHYGRSNGGNAGAEDEAVLLSQAVGKPVRVQWMRPDDLMWSTQSPAGFSEVEIGLTRAGTLQPTKSITTCPQCRTTVQSAPSSRVCRQCLRLV